MQAISTPPAQRARRLRLTRFILGMSLAVLIVSLALVFDWLGLLVTKRNQIVFVVATVAGWGSFMIWNAMTWLVCCPQCGWNIMLVAFTPSECPNCGLDLERTYDPKR
jgi:hypothetical protein